ncbi:hypothetical protein BGZ98_001428 [Dissophora globulifera]|nr:hypothetical protein BGZ98_001428 [Dissophora globulifera]
MTTRTPFKIDFATTDDIDAIAKIAGDGFKTDTHTLMKDVWKGNDHHRDRVKEDVQDQLANPRIDVLVARKGADGTGEVIGSIYWARRCYPENDDGSAPAQRDTSKATVLPPHPPPVLPASPSSPLTVKELEETTGNAMNHYVSHLMPPGVKCRIIIGLGVAPEYQGQGVGSALMKWGTDKADEEGVYTWVSSSMDGHQAYAKAGYIEVGRLELRLDDYAQGVRRKVKNEDGEEVEQDWGVYIWRWMRRDPK